MIFNVVRLEARDSWNQPSIEIVSYVSLHWCFFDVEDLKFLSLVLVFCAFKNVE